MRAQFPEMLTLESDSIERLLISSVMGKPLSTLYLYLTVAHDKKTTRSLDKGQEDIPALGEDEWEDCISTFIPSMTAAKDRFIQLKFIHRAYYTPHRMASIYPNLDPGCPRCNTEVGTFWHMVWTCSKIQTYWENIARNLSELSGTRVPAEPLVLLLSYLGDRYTKLCNLLTILC